MKNKIAETEKKEIKVLTDTRSKIHNMKAHLKQMEFDDSTD